MQFLFSAAFIVYCEPRLRVYKKMQKYLADTSSFFIMCVNSNIAPDDVSAAYVSRSIYFCILTYVIIAIHKWGIWAQRDEDSCLTHTVSE